MSRTYKHIKRVKLKKFYQERWDTLYDKYKYETTYSGWAGYRVETDKVYIRSIYLKKPGVLPKLRKELDTEDHWMSTPSWWTRLCMIKPQRREGSLWEREVVRTSLEELDAVDTPNISRKPHIYYY